MTTSPFEVSRATRGALGYLGLSYLESNKKNLKAVEIDGGDGCVAPSIETVQDGTYKPLSRPLFVYIKTKSLARIEVETFAAYLLDNADSLARGALFVPLTPDQLDEAYSVLDGASAGAMSSPDFPHAFTSKVPTCHPPEPKIAATYELGGSTRMRRLSHGTSVLAATVAVLALALAAAATASTSRTGVSGKISADGSSTVGPYVTAAAERFERRNPGAKITVGISGTGGGFERFCRGETDLSNASRPIKQSESTKCRENGVRYIAFLVANDGLSVVVNKGVTWINCITPAELKKIWDRGSTVDNWSQVRQGFPNVPLKLYGPGTDSGTFDFFTEKINGKAKQSRSDYTASEDDNVLVRGVEGDRGAMGYFGYSYYVENKSRLKLLKVHNGSRCVAPSIATVQAGTYKPLSRPLFVYAKRTSFQRAVVRAFIKYIILNERTIARASRYVPLTKAQLRKAKRQYNNAIKGN